MNQYLIKKKMNEENLTTKLEIEHITEPGLKMEHPQKSMKDFLEYISPMISSKY